MSSLFRVLTNYSQYSIVINILGVPYDKKQKTKATLCRQ